MGAARFSNSALTLGAPLASASCRALMTPASRSRSGLTAIDVRHPDHSGEAGVSPENAQSGAFGSPSVVGPVAVEHPMTEPANASRARDAIRRMGEHPLVGETMMRWSARLDAG